MELTASPRAGLDWSMECRADIGHAIIDIAPEPPAHPCYAGWYARRLGIASHDPYETAPPVPKQEAMHRP